MAKKMKLTDAEIVSAVDAHVNTSIGYHDSRLARERQNVLKYYKGELPKPHHSGNSRYVSMDVYDTVESAKSQILEVFANDSLLKFDPQGADDVQLAKIASTYTDFVLHRQNDSFGLIETVVHDALMSRNGIAKVYWDTCYTEHEESFDGIDVDDLYLMLEDPELTVKEYTTDSAGLLSGTVIRKKNTSQVRIDPIPAEEFIIASRATSLKSASFCGHRCEKTISELKKEGYPAKLVDKISTDENTAFDEEKQIRFDEALDSSMKEDFTDATRTVVVIECYVHMDIEGTGKTQYWKIIKAGDVVLDKEQVARHPFKSFAPLPIPHSFWGSNFAHKAVPLQNARTVLIRGILDHTVMTNNPRTVVVKGSLVNPREMLENRVGGVVNVTRPDGIFPYPQASLNPFVFQTIQLLDEDKEDTTGVSKLSQGLNKDALSSQNAQGMVEQLIGLSQQRQKIVARNFARQFLAELYLEIYQLVIENEDKQKVIEVAGEWIEIDPSKWAARTEVSTAFRLGYGEQEKDAQEDLLLHQMLSADPTTAPMYTMEKKYNLLSSYMTKKGRKNVDDYLVHPSKVEPPQPDPMIVHQIEMEKKDREIAERKVVLAEQQAMHSAQMDDIKIGLQKTQEMISLMLDQREQERKEFDSKTRAMTAERELDIIENTPAAEVKQSHIISPNS